MPNTLVLFSAGASLTRSLSRGSVLELKQDRARFLVCINNLDNNVTLIFFTWPLIFIPTETNINCRFIFLIFLWILNWWSLCSGKMRRALELWPAARAYVRCSDSASRPTVHGRCNSTRWALASPCVTHRLTPPVQPLLYSARREVLTVASNVHSSIHNSYQYNYSYMYMYMYCACTTHLFLSFTCTRIRFLAHCSRSLTFAIRELSPLTSQP